MSETRHEKSPKEMAKHLRLDSEEYVLRKRLPNHLPKRKNDIYVNLNTNINIQINKCQKVLDCGQYPFLLIHGLGKAVNTAINIGLQLKESNDLQMSCNTSSVDIIDDLEPIGGNRDINESFTQKRTVSAIHIKLFPKQNKMS